MGFRDDFRFFMGARLTETPKVGVPLHEAAELADLIVREIAPYSEYLLVAGSIRRARPQIGDVDLVVLPKDLDELLEALDRLGFHGGNRIQRKSMEGLPVEIYIAHHQEELGALSLYATGDRIWNIALRRKAQKKGWTLNQYGLFDARTLKPVLQSAFEGDFLEALNLPWHDPQDRSLLHQDEDRSRMGGPEEE